MTCKDCIHEKVCEANTKETAQMLNFTLLEDISGNADRCEFFKNKADYVEAKRAEWIKWYPPMEFILTGEELLYCCSNCDAKYTDVKGYKYCPFCGAFIDGERKEENAQKENRIN